MSFRTSAWLLLQKEHLNTLGSPSRCVRWFSAENRHFVSWPIAYSILSSIGRTLGTVAECGQLKLMTADSVMGTLENIVRQLQNNELTDLEWASIGDLVNLWPYVPKTL